MVKTLADTGAQSILLGQKNFKDADFVQKNLPPVLITTRAANNT